jgi:hypothetical protein|tara:strand:- start:1650 stop:1778 length:129 start_codon:yes stop_codon:yes gene_type:complete
MINKIIDMLEKIVDAFNDEDVFTIFIFFAYTILFIQIFRALI